MGQSKIYFYWFLVHKAHIILFKITFYEIFCPKKFQKTCGSGVTFKVDQRVFSKYWKNKLFKPGRVIIFWSIQINILWKCIFITTTKLCFADLDMYEIGHTRTKMVHCKQYPSLLQTQHDIIPINQYFLSSLYIGQSKTTKLKRN